MAGCLRRRSSRTRVQGKSLGRQRGQIAPPRLDPRFPLWPNANLIPQIPLARRKHAHQYLQSDPSCRPHRFGWIDTHAPEGVFECDARLPDPVHRLSVLGARRGDRRYPPPPQARSRRSISDRTPHPHAVHHRVHITRATRRTPRKDRAHHVRLLAFGIHPAFTPRIAKRLVQAGQCSRDRALTLLLTARCKKR
ncbi:MAG: hypothetical protein KatS3mg082_3170 [Nitrospiraceae bacterium]|nr:MAG: hypothetical protein KatS3mg082_3170 [Nitrospiraceae bacterium]